MSSAASAWNLRTKNRRPTSMTTTTSTASSAGDGWQENEAGNEPDKSSPRASSVASVFGVFESLPPATQFVALAMGVFLFFGVHNVLQEAMMKVEGFKFGVMLGWMEVLGVTVCSYLERTFIAKETGRVAPLGAYPPLTICLLASSSLASLSLNYINFPTKVVFRSCKLVPTMAIATIVNKKVFTGAEYVAALAVCSGLILFAAADWTLTEPTFHPLGLTLVSLSVCADAVLPNAQERLFRHGSSRLEVTFYTNLFTLIVQSVSTLLSGDMLGLFRLALLNGQLATYMAVYTFIAYIAVSMHMTVVKRYGGVAAVFVGTARKGMTLILSFLLFPKEFSWYYLGGAILVLGGLTASSLIKAWGNAAKKEREKSEVELKGLLEEKMVGESQDVETGRS